MIILRAASDNLLLVHQFTDQVSGALVSDAVVTVSLFDKNGMPIANAQGLPCAAVAGQPGEYAGNLPASVVLTDGQRGIARFIGTKAGFTRTLDDPFTVTAD